MVPSSHGSAAPPSLPPSVEEAYRRKCIELRKRLTEVETNNDRLRERQLRLSRGIMKMRYERAVLLEALKKRMKKNGTDGPLGTNDDESEDSSEAPPTPQERPLRTKKSHRRLPASPPPVAQQISGSATLSGVPPSGTFNSTPVPPVGFSGVSGSPAVVPAAPSSPPGQSFGSNHVTPSQDIPHPPAPKQMYTEHLLNNVLPSDPNLAAEIKEGYNNDVNAYGENEWRLMNKDEKEKWNSKYEEQMREYEKAMDEKKRARRGKRSAGASDDVEMED